MNKLIDALRFRNKEVPVDSVYILLLQRRNANHQFISSLWNKNEIGNDFVFLIKSADDLYFVANTIQGINFDVDERGCHLSEDSKNIIANILKCDAKDFINFYEPFSANIKAQKIYYTNFIDPRLGVDLIGFERINHEVWDATWLNRIFDKIEMTKSISIGQLNKLRRFIYNHSKVKGKHTSVTI